MKAQKLIIEGKEITIKVQANEDYICLTDMVKGHRDAGYIFRNWLRSRDTLEFLSVWEKINNESFNSVGADSFITSNVGKNTFSPSIKDWVSASNAIGIYSKAGRYGGIYAHRDIAFNFGYWVSPTF